MAKSLVPYLLSGERERGVYFFSFFHNLFIQSLLLQLKNGRETMRYHVKKHKKKHISWNCFFHTLSCCSYSCSDQTKALFNRKAASAISSSPIALKASGLSLSLSLCGWWGRWKSFDFVNSFLPLHGWILLLCKYCCWNYILGVVVMLMGFDWTAVLRYGFSLIWCILDSSHLFFDLWDLIKFFYPVGVLFSLVGLMKFLSIDVGRWKFIYISFCSVMFVRNEGLCVIGIL